MLLKDNRAPHIFAFCETFLDEKTSIHDLEINIFVFERRDHSHKKGGGILVYLNNAIMYERLSNLESGDIESIWLKVKPKHSKSFLLGNVYRPPDSKQMWIDTFEQQLNIADTHNLDIYIQ